MCPCCALNIKCRKCTQLNILSFFGDCFSFRMWKLGVKRIAVLGTLSRYNAEIKYFESVMETGLPGKLNMLQMQ